MFILHSSNKTENLLEHLVSVIEHSPLQSPFSKEVFLIQSQGMERWLSQQLASRFDVWANYEYLFPGRFFSTIAQQIGKQIDDSPYERDLVLWRIETLLRHLDGELFLPIIKYLSGSNPALKRFQLAQQIAQVFDQYQIMRPDMLAVWQQNRLLYNSDDEHWQQALWLKLKNNIGQAHRGELWLSVIDRLNNSELGNFGQLIPERIAVFGVNTMPPLFLAYLQALAKHCDVHFFLLNPAQTFWADLARKHHSQEDSYTGHPLLASLGQQGREFQAMLLDIGQFDVEPKSFEAIAKPNNLQQLQNDILDNANKSLPLQPDGSIRIHACHSRRREIEVLRDQLLFALESNPTLELRDIAVMAPDIQLYEPFISATFNDIQHAIADRSLRLDNQTLNAFTQFLEVSQGRLGWQGVLDLLSRPEIFPNFGLSEQDLELISFWVQDTNVRWGQSGQHKAELGLPASSENTWQAALDRLLMGYAVGHEDDFIDDILPYPYIEGSTAQALGGLHDFLQLLFQAKDQLKQAKTLHTWGRQLGYFAGQLLGKPNATADFLQRQPLNEILSELTDGLAKIHDELVELPVIRQWLNNRISEHKSSNGFLRGQLTFCSMLPMRSIPFKVIALIGLNEGEFPKIDRRPTFDLMAEHFRNGDRSHRADNRYQFLEILLSAREQLIITYQGRSQATNETIAPSVVVSELLEVMRDFYGLTDLVVLHPLQPFSWHYFDGTKDLFSYSESDCTVAQALALPKLEPASWWQGTLPSDDNKNDIDIIELNDLFRFYQHPQRYFFQRQLNLKLTGLISETPEREPFSANESGLYWLQQEWIDHLLNESNLSLKHLQTQGRWPAGAVGELQFEQQHLGLQNFANTLKQTGMGTRLSGQTIDIKIKNYRLIGTLNNLYEHGILLYRFANLKGKDFISAWLHHLLIHNIQAQDTRLICTDDQLYFKSRQHVDGGLIKLIDIYLAGLQQPNAFFTEVALAYLKQAANPKSKKIPSLAALDTLKKLVEFDHELELKQLFNQVDLLDSVLTEEFIFTCENTLLPVWLGCHEP